MKDKVRNMRSITGNPVPNQFVISDAVVIINHRILKGTMFQSYESNIAFVDYKTDDIYLDSDKWDYSTTTSRYRNIFLNSDTKETLEHIESGEYELVNLND